MHGFPAGLVLGVLIGLIVGPLVRAWMLWQEIEWSRRESSRADELLDGLDQYLSASAESAGRANR